MSYVELVNHTIENNSQVIRELNALKAGEITNEKVNAMLLSNLVSIISALALCVADIADNLEEG